MPSTNSARNFDQDEREANRTWSSLASVEGSKQGGRGKWSCGSRKEFAAKRRREGEYEGPQGS